MHLKDQYSCKSIKKDSYPLQVSSYKCIFFVNTFKFIN